jgi:hypothetical protein
MERAIHFALAVHAPPETVWRLLVEPGEIPRWWEGVREVQLSAPQVGGRYVLVYESGAPDVAEILGRTPRRLRFWRTHFRPPGGAPRTSGAPGSASAPRRETPLVHRTQRAEREHVPTYATAHGLLYLLIVLVLLCGAAWILTTLLRA